MRNVFGRILRPALLSLLGGCASNHNAIVDVCDGYLPNPAVSEYILPFPRGGAYKVIQGNCAEPRDPWTHHGVQRHAYDFEMPIGSALLAVRAGTVLFARDSFTDEQHGKNQGNAMVLLHTDGTYALYGHLTKGGARVRVGQVVSQGDTIGFSGNSGQSPLPHLHIQVSACGDFVHCPSIPVSFRNVAPAVSKLLRDSTYLAL